MLSPGGLAAGGCTQQLRGGLLHTPLLRRSLRRPGCANTPLVWSASAAVRAAPPRAHRAAAAAAAAACGLPRVLVAPRRAVAARAFSWQRGAVFAAARAREYDSGSESDGERSGSALGITMSQLLERHSVAFPVQTYGNKQTQRAVRVWARAVQASGEWEALTIVDAPPTRGSVAWRSWTAKKWEEAALALKMPMSTDQCVRMRTLSRSGRSSWHIVWGDSGPLGAPEAAPTPFVYVFVPGGVDRFVPLAELRALAAGPGVAPTTLGVSDSESDDESVGGRVLFLWSEARKQLDELFKSKPTLLAAAAAVLGLPPGSDAAAVLAAPQLSQLPPPERFAADEAGTGMPSTATKDAIARAAERAARAAAEAKEAAVVAERMAVDFATRAGVTTLSPGADPVFASALSAGQLLSQKKVAFSFLTLPERIKAIKFIAAEQGFPMDPAVVSNWNNASWTRAADGMGITFRDNVWAPLSKLPPGWHVAWHAKNATADTCWVAAPTPQGPRFFTLGQLHQLVGQTPPVGLPSWEEVLDALQEAARPIPALVAAVDADLEELNLVDAWRKLFKSTRRTAPEDAAASRARAAEEEAGPAADVQYPGLSPVDMYLQLGLGFAFMKLGGAESKRIMRAVATAAKRPLGTANSGWDKSEWAAASEELQLTWLPEGTNSCSLASLGRGVRAAWGAGRVYIYAPAPVDRFMQTTIIKAGFCDAALRPVGLPRGEPFSAWPRVVDELAEAAATNPHLRAALRADAVFPKDVLPTVEETGDAVDLAPPAMPKKPWEEDGSSGSDEDALPDFADDDGIFAPVPVAEPLVTQFAPSGKPLTRLNVSGRPFDEEYGREDVVVTRGIMRRAHVPDPALNWPIIPQLEREGIILSDVNFKVFQLHSCAIFIRKLPDGRLDLRQAFGVGKKGKLNGRSKYWRYTKTWWELPSDVVDDMPASDYQVITWTRRVTLKRSRGDRRNFEEAFIRDWVEEKKRLYFIRRRGFDMSLPESERPLDFQTVFMIPNRKPAIHRMPVVGLLIPVTPEEYAKYPTAEDAYFAPLEDLEYEDEDEELAEETEEGEVVAEGEEGEELEEGEEQEEDEELEKDLPRTMLDFRVAIGPDEYGVNWDDVPTSEVEEEPAETVDAVLAKLTVEDTDGAINLQAGHPVGHSLLKGPPKADVEYIESWNLPHDAYLCIAKDFLYVSTPNAMDSSEELVYKFLKKRRWDVRPDGTVKGNASRINLSEDDVESMRIQEDFIFERLENQGFIMTPDEVKKVEAAEDARTEAMDQWDREAMFEEFETEGFD